MKLKNEAVFLYSKQHAKTLQALTNRYDINKVKNSGP